MLMRGWLVVAAASLPDPSWIAGMYDDGDADSLLALVWEEAPAVAPPPRELPKLAPSAVSPAPVVGALVAVSIVPADSRSPPAN
jgi:hypothetical protein